MEAFIVNREAYQVPIPKSLFLYAVQTGSNRSRARIDVRRDSKRELLCGIILWNRRRCERFGRLVHYVSEY